MSMDYERDRSDNSTTEQGSDLFAAQPIWERRGKKRGMFGRKAPARTATAATAAPMVSPEPRSFAAERDYDDPMALDTPVATPGASRTLGHDYVRVEDPARFDSSARAAARTDETDAGLVAPIGRPTARADRGPKSKGVGPAAIVAGVVALGALGTVGWMATRDDDGIPEIAPGPPVEVADGAAALPPVLPPAPPAVDTAVNPLPPSAAAAPRTTVRAAQPVRTAQARPRPAAAAAPSASDSGVNASTTTTLPSGPQPYSTLNPGATPPPPVNPAPTQAAPPPTEAPAIPQTTPTLPTEPAPETTVTPPTS